MNDFDLFRDPKPPAPDLARGVVRELWLSMVLMHLATSAACLLIGVVVGILIGWGAGIGGGQ